MRPESGNRGRLLKTFSRFAVKVLLNLVTVTVVKVGQLNASHEIVFDVSRSGYVSRGTVPIWKDYDKLRNIVRNIPGAENTIQ